MSNRINLIDEILLNSDGYKEPESEKKGKLSIAQKWFFVVVINILLLLIGYKIIFADIQFTFSELLSLILALFSISISVAFYFKATDSSNKFYDNSYKFTKDIAELLVKIENRFGEKLDHLDKSYDSMSTRLESFSLPQIAEEKEKIKDELKKVTEHYKIKVAEKDKALNEALQREHLTQEERDNIINEFDSKQTELDKERKKVELLEKQLNKLYLEQETYLNQIDFTGYIVRKLLEHKIDNNSTPENLKNVFKQLKFTEAQKSALRDLHIINNHDRLTPIGSKAILAWLRAWHTEV